MTKMTTLELEGLHCAACVGRAEKVLKAVPGIAGAEVNLAGQSARLTLSEVSALPQAEAALKKAGYGLRHETTRLALEGMTCASCVSRVERLAKAVPGVTGATANLAEELLVLEHYAGASVTAEVTAALAKAGYPAVPVEEARPDRQALEEAALRRRFLLAAVLTLPVFVTEMGGHLVPAFHHYLHDTFGMGLLWGLQAVLASLVIFGPGRIFLRRGLPALWRLAPDMNSLVALGTLAAWGYSMVAWLAPGWLPEASRAVYFEAAAVIVTLILAGRWMEARARGRTGAAIRRLVALQPDRALVEGENGAEERPASSLRAGDILLVRPGERLAADGLVLAGDSFVDESMITGEPVPVAKAAGTEVTGGTVNGAGALRVQISRAGADSRLQQIVRMVGDAQAGKLPIQAVVDRVTGIFVPVVLGVAGLTVAIWLLAGAEIAQALVAGVSVLIIACPCAMGLATPTSILVGTGRAAEFGILFRKGEALQRLAEIEAVGFDKTGTLTFGRPDLSDLVPAEGWDEAELLRLASAVEAQSEHPSGLAICRAAAARGLAGTTAEAVQTLAGQGIHGLVEGRRVALGNPGFMAAQGADAAPLQGRAEALAARGRSVVYVAVDGRLAGAIAVADGVKPGAAPGVAALQAAGLSVSMISGDGARTAQAVAAEIGISEVIAGVLPEGKVAAVAGRGKLAFVGDGINDAPVLAAAEVGIAMGQGTDVAIEAADVVLVAGDPRAVGQAVEIARATLRNIHENLFWAFAYNAALIPVAAGLFYPWLGWQISPMLAAGAMALSSVFVLGNALRLRRAGAPLAALTEARA